MRTSCSVAKLPDSEVCGRATSSSRRRGRTARAAATDRYSGLLTKPLARCAERAGLDKHITAHTMRRTFNNLARQAAGGACDDRAHDAGDDRALLARDARREGEGA